MFSARQTKDAEAKGMILPDSEKGCALGFTSDRFEGYLWESGKRIWISFIVSLQQGKGHLSELFRSIEAAGYCVAVPTPLPRMEAILKRKGFIRHIEVSELGDPVEVWMKPRRAASVFDVYDRAKSTIPAHLLTCHQEADQDTKDRVIAGAAERRKRRAQKLSESSVNSLQTVVV